MTLFKRRKQYFIRFTSANGAHYRIIDTFEDMDTTKGFECIRDMMEKEINTHIVIDNWKRMKYKKPKG